MRTTVTIDDELYQRALDVADPGMDKGDLFREAMKVFIRVQAGKRLAADPLSDPLSDPADEPGPRRHIGLDCALPPRQSAASITACDG